MIRVNVVVEGQTEEAFVKRVLASHLLSRQVQATPMIAPTKKGARKRLHRGGGATFEAARRFIRRKLADDASAYTTTMFDYYGLPEDFPGMGHADLPPSGRLDERVAFLEEQLRDALGGTRRLIPYLQVHEYEALLFSDVRAIDDTLCDLHGASSQLHRLQQIVADHGGPEAINDDPETAPSKRLMDLYPRYVKVVFGELIVAEIGMPRLCERCPHFGNWVERLEKLAPLS